MSTKIGRFEIISELAKSFSGAVYKASDPGAGRTVALKTIRLELLADLSQVLEQLILQEAESTKALNSQNIALLYGAGEIDQQFCAAMEYVEGNSLATMIARQEGFSIWDLLDISRQVCLALDHANSHNVLHRSLEPGKIMMQWDGTVKVLGYGVSTMVSAMQRPGSPVPTLYHYMSPEQVSGDDIDIRSNVFSWGAMLYEMVTDRKPFDAEDVQAVRQKILEETPEPPATINPRMNLAVSRVIMQALAKNPDERYASGQELVNDLDSAKQTTQAAAAKNASQPIHGLAVPEKVKASGQAAGKTSSARAAQTQSAAPNASGQSSGRSDKPARQNSQPASQQVLNAAGDQVQEKPKKAAAAAAGWPGQDAGGSSVHEIDAEAVSVRNSAASDRPTASMSAEVAEPEAEPKFRTDPMMSGFGGGSKQVSFSELDELPPLKEAYLPPASPTATTAVEELEAPEISSTHEPEKPKVITRENAKKAVNEIKKVPPKLFMYAVGGAIAFILIVVVALMLHIRSQNADDDSNGTARPMPQAAVPQETTAPAPATAPSVVAATPEQEPEVTVKPRYPVTAKPRKAPPAAVKIAIVPGELAISSTPEGAQIEMDGRKDPNWVTPYTIVGLNPGAHSITISKPGFTGETRNLDVTAGNKSFLVVHLLQVGATASLGSDPAGATVYIDGRDTGRVTPTQLLADKGRHTFLLRKQGYLDETTTVELSPGQTFSFSPSLKAMGITDDIKTVGKFNKLFGGPDVSGMGKVMIKTMPKGAQITVNRRMVDKPTPVNFALNPGHYIVEITLSGYKPVQKIINVEKGAKLDFNENLEPQ